MYQRAAPQESTGGLRLHRRTLRNLDARAAGGERRRLATTCDCNCSSDWACTKAP